MCGEWSSGVLNCVWPPTREEVEKVRPVRESGSRNMTDAKTNLLRVRKHIIILTYDPLLSNHSIFIVFTRMYIRSDNTTIIMRPISHNMTDELTNLLSYVN